MPKHAQTRVTTKEGAVDLDDAIVPLIRELWRAGLGTSNSCQAHEWTDLVWIEFARPEEVSKLLNIVAPMDDTPGSLWQKAGRWGFGSAMHTATARPGGTWRYHVSIHEVDARDPENPSTTRGLWATISVLFPLEDLPLVVSRLRRDNDFHNREDAPGFTIGSP